jgi:hypothetical protein
VALLSDVVATTTPLTNLKVIMVKKFLGNPFAFCENPYFFDNDAYFCCSIFP